MFHVDKQSGKLHFSGTLPRLVTPHMLCVLIFASSVRGRKIDLGIFILA